MCIRMNSRMLLENRISILWHHKNSILTCNGEHLSSFSEIKRVRVRVFWKMSANENFSLLLLFPDSLPWYVFFSFTTNKSIVPCDRCLLLIGNDDTRQESQSFPVKLRSPIGQGQHQWRCCCYLLCCELSNPSSVAHNAYLEGPSTTFRPCGCFVIPLICRTTVLLVAFALTVQFEVVHRAKVKVIEADPVEDL